MIREKYILSPKLNTLSSESLNSIRYEIIKDTSLRKPVAYIRQNHDKEKHLYCPNCHVYIVPTIYKEYPYTAYITPKEVYTDDSTGSVITYSGTWSGIYSCNSTSLMYDSYPTHINNYKCPKCEYSVKDSETLCVILNLGESVKIPTNLWIDYSSTMISIKVFLTEIHFADSVINKDLTAIYNFNLSSGISSLRVLKGSETHFEIKNLMFGLFGSSQFSPIVFYSKLLERILPKDVLNTLTTKLWESLQSILGFQLDRLSIRDKVPYYNTSTISATTDYISTWYSYDTDQPTPITLTSAIRSIPKPYKEALYYGENILIPLVLYNSLPTMDCRQYERLIEWGTYIQEPYKAFLHPALLKLNRAKNPIKVLLNIVGVRYCKSIANILSKNPNNIKTLLVTLRYFKDVNNACKVILWSGWECVAINKVREFNRNTDYDPMPFISFLIAKDGETIASNKIINDTQYLHDTINTYNKLREQEQKTNTILINPDRLSGSIEEIHDELSYIYDTISKPNQILTYTGYDQRVETCIDGYTFSLAKETHELRRVGRIMKHCVWTYADKVVEKSCIICVMWLEGKPLVCFELSGEATTIRQAKIFKNRLPEGELLEVIRKWVDHTKLCISTSDLRAIEPYEERRPNRNSRIYDQNTFIRSVTTNA